MRNLVPGWIVKGKPMCVECIGERPKGPWRLMLRSTCQGKGHGTKKMPKKKSA